jgi:hypothetical protein
MRWVMFTEAAGAVARQTALRSGPFAYHTTVFRGLRSVTFVWVREPLFTVRLLCDVLSAVPEPELLLE